MISVYIFGLGEGKKYLDRCLLKTVHICGYIDNYKAEQMNSLEGIPVIRQKEVKAGYDYIIITLMQYEEVKASLLKEGIQREKILSFFDVTDADNESNWQILDGYQWRMELLWRYALRSARPLIDNMCYEMYADEDPVKKGLPRIMDVESTVRILEKEKKCLARFGDGEFEIICGRSRAKFQNADIRLGDRLKEALHSRESNLLIAIANNYGSLAEYTDDAAMGIRAYMTERVRREHMSLLEPDRQYYDAYLSRPYMIYRDKAHAWERFERIRRIWGGQHVLVVEGEHTRFGVGNDLLGNAESVGRIIVPDRDAFDQYDGIKKAAQKYGKGKLILAVIGPTATVLAYDLAREDYWILDIGQLDTEYEWFLCGTEKRCGLKYKNVSEFGSCYFTDTDMEEDVRELYNSQIIEKVLI